MKILDCTMRDGGYINNWRFSKNFFNNYLEVCNNNQNIDYVEIGFLNKEEDYADKWNGQWRSLTNEQIDEYKNKFKNLKIAVMVDNKNKDLLKIKPRNESNIDLFRVAFHKNDYEKGLQFCKYLKDLGYEVSANLMATVNYTNEELQYVIERINEYNLDYVYIADSYGNLFPDDIRRLYYEIQKNNKKVKIGLHLHNNFQNAFANFLESIKLNIDIVDTTMYGMGRGVGNLTTEMTLSYLYKKNIIESNDFSLLQLLIFIEEYIVNEFYKNDNPWGYNLYYLITSYFDCHPNYVARLKTAYKKNKFNCNNVWKICSILKKQRKNQLFTVSNLDDLALQIGFSKK